MPPENADQVCQEKPLIDESSLENEAGRVTFLIQVFRYRCRRLQSQGLLPDDHTV